MKLTKLNQKGINLIPTDDGYTKVDGGSTTEPSYEDVKDA